MTDYSELVKRARALPAYPEVLKMADAIEALQAATGRWDDLQADRDHWKARAERAEADKRAMRAAIGSVKEQLDMLSRILVPALEADALDHQEGEQ